MTRIFEKKKGSIPSAQAAGTDASLNEGDTPKLGFFRAADSYLSI